MSEVRIVSAPFGGWDARVLEEHPDGHLRVEVLAQEGDRPCAETLAKDRQGIQPPGTPRPPRRI